jgi:hypothetical protein
MHLTKRFLEAVANAEDRSSSPLTFIWPMPGYPGGQPLSFSAFADWQAFVRDLGLRRVVPEPRDTCAEIPSEAAFIALRKIPPRVR